MIDHLICDLCGQKFEESALDGTFFYGPNSQSYYKTPCCHSCNYSMVLVELNADGPQMHPEDEANEELQLVHGSGYESVEFDDPETGL